MALPLNRFVVIICDFLSGKVKSDFLHVLIFLRSNEVSTLFIIIFGDPAVWYVGFPTFDPDLTAAAIILAMIIALLGIGGTSPLTRNERECIARVQFRRRSLLR